MYCWEIVRENIHRVNRHFRSPEASDWKAGDVLSAINCCIPPVYDDDAESRYIQSSSPSVDGCSVIYLRTPLCRFLFLMCLVGGVRQVLDNERAKAPQSAQKELGEE